MRIEALVLALGLAMKEGGAAPPPQGYVDYCRAQPVVCAADRATGGRPRTVTDADMAAAARLNARINRAIRPVADDDVWRDDTNVGDCEDYALAKRKALIAAGWAPGQALIALADLPDGRAHAVLILRTDRGDLVLDNLHDDILHWRAADMRFTHRQSAEAPAMWVRIDNGR